MHYLQWSDALETVATEWSSYCNFNHRSGTSSCSNALSALSSVDIDEYSSGDGCGENLYGSGADPTWSYVIGTSDYGIKGGIEDSWCVGEAASWSYGTSIGSAGHYTQVVWADTKYVGCGFYNCDSANGWMNNMFTCKYVEALPLSLYIIVHSPLHSLSLYFHDLCVVQLLSSWQL